MDQLSITSWLPGLCLVGNAALLLAMSNQASLSFSVAVGELAAMKWGALVVLLFATVSAAVAVQAFEFEILRFFEGYHRSQRLQQWAEAAIGKQRAHREALEKEAERLEGEAFTCARTSALRAGRITGSDEAAWNVLEKLILVKGWKPTAGDLESLKRASQLRWPRHAPAEVLHKWNLAKVRLSEFPAAHRVLPTRLGNAMRSAEDDVVLRHGQNLEGFVIRNYDRLPKTIAEEHDAYRARLEMYLAFVIVNVGLAALAGACLWHSTTSLIWRLVIPLLYVVGGWLCHRAAIASALGFGQALREAQQWIADHPESHEAVKASTDA